MQARRAIIASILLWWATTTLAQSPVPPQAPESIEFAEPQLSAEWSNSDEYVIRFPSASPSGNQSNDTVPMLLLLPKDRSGPVPVVMVLHYWGASDRSVERQLAFNLNKQGVGAALMTLPYHLERTPAGVRSGDLAIVPDPDRLLGTLLQSLQDCRRAIDFLSSSPLFRGKAVGATGLSLGGIVAALVYGVDERLTNAAFVLGGVDLAHILWNSSRVVSQREALRKRGLTEAKLREAFAPLEPLSFLRTRKQGHALVVGARYDTVIPPRSTDLLIEALNEPAELWLETGHYGGIFVQRRLLSEVAAFFGKELSGEVYVPPKGLHAPTFRLAVQYAADNGLEIGAGLDLASTGGRRPVTATGLLTPSGIQLFIGTRLDASLSFGVSLHEGGASVGVLWSRVL